MILTFAECFKNKGIFSIFGELDSDFISEILPDEDLTVLDDYSVFQIGNYAIFKPEIEPEKMARFCLLKNKVSWKNFNDSLCKEFNISGKTTTENNETVVDSDRTSLNKINGYDDSSLVSDSENTDNSDITQTETKTKTETRENPLEIIDRNIITQKNNKLIDMIVTDIKNTICLDSDCGLVEVSGGGSSSDLENRVETLESEVSEIDSEIDSIKSVIPENASTSNKLATDSDIPDVSGLATQSSVNAITDLIPSNASTSNKLATMSDISGGGSVTVDDSLSTTSENPVQNKVITNKINQVENSIPDVSGLATQSSVNAITDLIPSNASTSNKLATDSDIPDVSGLATQSSVNAITDLIPSNASTSNKLATDSDIPDVSGLATQSSVNAITDLIPSNASTSNKLATDSDIPDVSGLATQSSVNAITDLIPSNASTSNKLATMSDISGGSSEITVSDTPEYINEKLTIGNTTYKKYKVLLDLTVSRQLVYNGTWYTTAWKSPTNENDITFFYGKMKDFLTNNSVYAITHIKLYDSSFTNYFDIPDVQIDKTNHIIKNMILPKLDFSTSPTTIYPFNQSSSDFGTKTMRYIEVEFLSAS